MKIYLSGEIHTDWRQQIQDGCADAGLDVTFLSPVTDHAASDAAGDLLGVPESGYWRDHQSSRVNLIRTQTKLQQADLAVIRFGEQYKQWNAAFDAGFAHALGKSVIVLQMEEHNHALKEVDAAAQAVCYSATEVAQCLTYILKGTLP